MSQLQQRSIRLRPFASASLDDLTGSSGEIFYDFTNNTLRVSNGTASGSSTLATQNYVNSIVGSSNKFSSIAVQGQSTITADSTSDTLTLVGGQNIVITTNSSTDTITIGLPGSFVVQGGDLGTPSSGNLVNCTFPILNQNTTGSAASAATLTTSRNINGVSFNGSSDITVTAASNTLTGNTLNSTVTTSSLTSVGTLTNLTVTGDVTANSNVVVAQTPTSINHATNKKYVDARAVAMSVALS